MRQVQWAEHMPSMHEAKGSTRWSSMTVEVGVFSLTKETVCEGIAHLVGCVRWFKPWHHMGAPWPWCCVVSNSALLLSKF